MRTALLSLCLAAACIGAASQAYPSPDQAATLAQPGDMLIQDATVMTATHGTLEHTSILVRAGKITAIGPSLSAPAGVAVVDGKGKYVIPGIIDEHSHTAVDGGVNEGAPSISAMTRIKDVINPHDVNLYRQLAGGVTIIHIFHGSANEIGGEDAVVRLKWGLPVDEMLYPGAPQGIKFALGENPKQTANPHGRYPATRQGVNDAIRTAFLQAQAYKKQWDDYHAAVARGEPVYPPRTDLNLEPLVGILDGKILVHSHSYVSAEIQALIDDSDEFHFHIATLEHCLEAYKLVNEIKAHNIGCSTFADDWSYKEEAVDGIAYNAALLEQKGVRAAINSDDDGRARRLYMDAAKVIHYGNVSEQTALQTITLNPAWMLGIDKTVGSIDVGKDADFAIFNGDPFGPSAMVVATIIDGRVFFDRSQDLARRKKVAEYENLFQPGLNLSLADDGGHGGNQ
ncbi:MAG TPA: amidohydrolase family protein [Terriglobales bacterium]|nr:amidohydrolase family protein [Terriglobales bacterium]